MTFILLWLTFDTANRIRAGAGRVPDWTVINYEIHLVWDAEKRRQVPAVGQKTGFFGKTWSRDEAYRLVNKGKMRRCRKGDGRCPTCALPMRSSWP